MELNSSLEWAEAPVGGEESPVQELAQESKTLKGAGVGEVRGKGVVVGGLYVCLFLLGATVESGILDGSDLTVMGRMNDDTGEWEDGQRKAVQGWPLG